MKEMKEKTWYKILQVLVAALTALITALTTTSCIGHGPVNLTAWL